MLIALDAMGGDHAPGPIVAGAVQAVAADPQLSVLLVGDQAQVEPLLSGVEHRERLPLFHCTQAVGMEESPVVALRKKPDNSISRCWQLLAQQKVEGIVSAGNTGAMVAGGLFLKRYLKNVRRPGIAAVMPTVKGPCVLIDVGANVNPKPEHLFQYGVMGSIFARHILQRPQPTIGLMNVGSEEQKGHDLAKDTHALFNASPLRSRFVGNVEGRDIHRGDVDVVVCDGFVGNVVLKTSEGVFEFTMKMVFQELLGALDVERAKAKQALEALIHRYDYSAFGGAPLLGIDGVCIICHGSSGERAIQNALGVAANYARARLNELIVKELESSSPACERERISMARVAFLFPGQGAQTVGMARDLCASLPQARQLFTEASEQLGYDLLEICVNGPAERLNSTVVSQPALFVASLAALESLKQSEPHVLDECVAAAGLSLGEFTALTFAGALTFAEGLRLVQRRGEAMQAAADLTPSGMVSVLTLERAKVEELCAAARQDEILQIANYLCPGNYAVSGHRSACDRLEPLVAEAGGRTVRLAVAGAFHTPLMKPADEAMVEVFASVPLTPPRMPVWSNVTAQPHGSPEETRALLRRQMTQPVRWEDTMRHLLAAGCERFYEIGPGRVLAGLLKRVQRKVDCRNVGA